ncbi:MAG: CHAT domain-containing protein [Salibacteraceae bacterium]
MRQFFICCLLLGCSQLFAQRVEESPSILEQWIKSHKTRAGLLRDSGELDRAEVVIDSALRFLPSAPQTTSEMTQLAWLYANQGYLLGDMQGRFLEAREAYQLSLKWHTKAGNDNFWTARFVLEPLANIYTRFGENLTAIDLLTRMVEHCRAAEQNMALAEGYNDLGLAYSNRNMMEEAAQQFEAGLQVPNLSAKTQGILLSNMADINALSDPQVAFEIAQNAVAILKSDDPFPGREAYILGALQMMMHTGSDLLDSNQIEQQWQQLQLMEQEAYGDQYHRKRVKSRTVTGTVWLKSGYPEKALQFFHQALNMSFPGFESQSLLEVPATASGLVEPFIIDVIQGKMASLMALHERNPAQDQYLKAYLAHTNFRFQQELEVRSLLLSEQAKFQHLEELHEDGERAVAAALQLWKSSGDQQWLATAFQYAERTKGLLLTEKLQTVWRSMAEDSGNTTLQALKSVEEQRAQHLILWDGQSPKDSAWVQLEQERAHLRDQLTRYYSGLPQSISEEVAVNLPQLQKWIEHEKCPVFTSLETEGRLYLFWLSADALKLEEVAITASLKSDLEAHANWLQAPAAPDRAAADRAHRIYQRILEPFNAEISQCDQFLAVTDRLLSRTQFETLLTASTTASDYREWPFLARRWSVAYAPSIKQLLRKSETIAPKTFSGWAPDFSCAPDLATLPTLTEDWAALAQEFEGSWKQGPQASWATFLEEAPTSRVLHLQTHALAALENPNRSWLALQADSSTCDLRKLYLAQLFSLRLKAELLVLGACETAKGVYFKGVGTRSLSQSFAFSGCRNTVASPWKINPQSTDQILLEFYRHLQSGKRINQSLSEAKRAYLNAPTTDSWSAHPSFWAGLVVLGGGEALHDLPSAAVANPFSAGWIVALFGLVLLFFLMRGRFARH